jgi:exosome complex exonuclease DIS3/RRP44
LPTPVAGKKASGELQPTGRIVGVVRRNWRPYVGRLDIPAGMEKATSVGSKRVMFIALDRRIPRIRIQTKNLARLAGKRVVVAIDRWSRRSKVGFFSFPFSRIFLLSSC